MTAKDGADAPSVDLQRTRNQQEGSGGQRPYTPDEFDVLAVCFFARTLCWEFLYAWDLPVIEWPRKKNRKKDTVVYDVYDPKLIIKPGVWFATLEDCLGDWEANR